jgi:hypothetical protein
MTPAEARELFDYDPESGELTWKIRAARCVTVGARAGSLKRDGYVQVTFRKKCFQAHRVAWAVVHGVWPGNDIDHINGERSDNRLANLRVVTPEENMQNQRRAHRSNKSSGLLGVHFYARTGRWKATIWSRGQNQFLGYFSSAAEAQSAYLSAKERLHPGFCAKRPQPSPEAKAA